MKKWILLAAASLCGSAILAQEAPFKRNEYTPDLEPGRRPRVAAQPFLYPEVQYKYGLFQNLLGMYIDRPLFFDRSLRYPAGTFAYTSPESYFRDIGIIKSYGFDGSGSLALGILNLYKQVNSFLDANPDRAKGHLEYPQFAFGEMGKFSASNRQLNEAREILKIALKSPYAPKVNGRIPITTYNSGFIKPEIMKEFLDTLRKEFGDTFIVTGGLLIDWQDSEEFMKSGKWSDATQQKYRDRIKGLLDLFGGIQVPLLQENYALDYMSIPDFGIYDRYLQSMLEEILALPEYRTKLAGAIINHGYINHMSGVSHGEFGTARLRLQLDRLVRFNPDFIVFFEWNEFNENTCFQPTLCNSMALQRLIRFYSNTLKGKVPEPNAGDDPAIPPLVFSSRETLKVGEPLEFELLNIPDSTAKADYTAQLSVFDQSGKAVVSFPVETFNRAQLRAITYTVPTEALSRHTVLLPELTVSSPEGKKLVFNQLQYIRLLPSFCYNYKAVRQPLRDLLLPRSVDFKAVAKGSGNYQLSGKIDAGELLSSLEVTDFGREFYAVDPDNEFDREKNIVVLGTISTIKSSMSQLKLQVTDADGWKFRPWEQANVSFGSWRQDSDTMTSNTLLWCARTQMLLTIPGEAQKAEVRFSVGNETKSFPLTGLRKLGKIAQVYDKCRADWQILHSLPDIPPVIGRNTAEFSVTLPSERVYPIFQLRAVTKSGKIYRSAPIIPNPIPGILTKFNVISETSGKVVTTEVPKALIPVLKYKLDPERGAMVVNTFDPYFDAQLGGGFVYDEPFQSSIALPEENHVPEFVTDDGRPALKFSNSSSYINFPLESFPRGSFTLKFEVKPESGSDSYVLFRHFSSIVGSVTVYVKYDKLYLAFGDKELKTRQFASGFTLKPGIWSKVTIVCDQKQLNFEVNGEKRSYELEAPLRALYFKPSVFGGHTKPEFGLPPGFKFYRGLLRDLEIRHDAEDIR
jgi:hypothetical protein